MLFSILNAFTQGLLQGFGLAIGFLFGILFLIMIIGVILKTRKSSEKPQPTLAILEDYKKNLVENDQYEEAGKIENFIESLTEGKQLTTFFEEYEIVTVTKYIEEDLSSEEKDKQNSFLGIVTKKSYYMRKKSV